MMDHATTVAKQEPGLQAHIYTDGSRYVNHCPIYNDRGYRSVLVSREELMEGYGIWIVEFRSVIDGPGLWVLCIGGFCTS
jgi:hypothetical protein